MSTINIAQIYKRLENRFGKDEMHRFISFKSFCIEFKKGNINEKEVSDFFALPSGETMHSPISSGFEFNGYENASWISTGCRH
jgi:hypothetical protein